VAFQSVYRIQVPTDGHSIKILKTEVKIWLSSLELNSWQQRDSSLLSCFFSLSVCIVRSSGMMCNKFTSQITEICKKTPCVKRCILSNFALTHQTQILTNYAQKTAVN